MIVEEPDVTDAIKRLFKGNKGHLRGCLEVFNKLKGYYLEYKDSEMDPIEQDISLWVEAADEGVVGDEVRVYNFATSNHTTRSTTTLCMVNLGSCSRSTRSSLRIAGCQKRMSWPQSSGNSPGGVSGNLSMMVLHSISSTIPTNSPKRSLMIVVTSMGGD